MSGDLECAPACWRGPTEAGGRDFGFNSGSWSRQRARISLSSNNIRDNRGRGFLSATEDPRDSLLPTDVVGEQQRIWARLVSAPSGSSSVVACSESTCQRVGVRLLSRAQWRWRSGRLNARLGPAQTALSWPSRPSAAAYRCGRIQGDVHGHMQAQTAEEFMRSQNVRHPESFVRMLLPRRLATILKLPRICICGNWR